VAPGGVHSVLYLDSDVIITENIDHLFLRARSPEFDPSQAGAAPDVSDSEHFNAGVILLRPNVTAFARLAAASRAYLRTAEKPDDQVGWGSHGRQAEALATSVVPASSVLPVSCVYILFLVRPSSPVITFPAPCVAAVPCAYPALRSAPLHTGS